MINEDTFTPGVEAAAQAEREAEQGRADAEAVWRQAWWTTTLALAAPADSDRLAVGDAYDTAVRVLGQSRQWMAKRRRAGLALKDLSLEGKIFSLPPRLAMEYVASNGDPALAAETLASAEERDLSLRDFAAELGTQPKSWLRENEQDQRPAPPPQDVIGNWTPDQRADAIKTLTKDDDLMSDPTVSGHVGGALERAHDRRREEHARNNPHGQPTPDPEYAEYAALFLKLRRTVNDVAELVARRRPAKPESFLPLVATAKETLGMVEAALQGSGDSLEQALESILKDGAS